MPRRSPAWFLQRLWAPQHAKPVPKKALENESQMNHLLHELVACSASRSPHGIALRYKGQTLSYEDLAAAVTQLASVFLALGIGRGERIGVYLDKRIETVVSCFGAAAAGAVFVPINPLLKAAQVSYILQDCNVRILVTTNERLETLAGTLPECVDLQNVILAGSGRSSATVSGKTIFFWDEALQAASNRPGHRTIDADMTAILYTSGSTGRPKGVVLSHRNMVAGAYSVAQYLENRPSDRILSALPLSFDAGFSQLTTAFSAGASVVLINYLLPADVINTCGNEGITGLTAVPPLWIQLAALNWPESARASLRYFANTGGRMPRKTLEALRASLPNAKPYLMYGLTEAFRSTYLPPAEVDRRPDSIGKAIPNAEILVVHED